MSSRRQASLNVEQTRALLFSEDDGAIVDYSGSSDSDNPLETLNDTCGLIAFSRVV